MEFYLSSERLWHDINQSFSGRGGAYIVRSRDAKNKDLYKGIHRLLGKDETGVLYIGKASSFLNRVIELSKSLAPDYRAQSHFCGVRYKASSEIQMAFPYKLLVVELLESDDPVREESKLLREYEKLFGEIPPLNRMG
tara:strand:+ start:1580 stop:1993 length:414 start_codon:yes stop_codon:yes gene_type:complete